VATVAAEIEVPAAPLVAWDLYFDPDLWPAWVDQFVAVVESAGYPQVGGTMRWRSGRAGRGEVTERVLAHEAPSRHRVSFSDPQAEGELAVAFEASDAGTVIRQELAYRLKAGGIFARAADLLFVRSQMRASLQRSLAAFAEEVEERAAGGL
jgi:Polyketide cyclase / dehydrase and lipid transport